MLCSQGDPATLNTGLAPGSNTPPFGLPDYSQPQLILSNSPEQIPLGGGNLYRCYTVQDLTRSNWYRVFIWHVNKSGGDLYVRIAGGGGGTVTAMRGMFQNGDVLASGKCLAKAQLFGTLDPIPLSSFIDLTSIGPDIPIWMSPLIPNNGNCFAVIEFECSYAPSVCIAAAPDPLLFPPSTQDVLPADPATNAHPRGWWPYSAANMESGVGADGCDLGVVGQVGIADSSGYDSFLFHNQGHALDPDGTGPDNFYTSPNGNAGLFGVNLNFSFFIVNKCEFDAYCHCRLLARHTDDPFVGAAWVVPNGDGNKLGVPQINFGAVTNSADLDGPFDIPADTYPEVFESFQIAVGGGAATPVNFVCWADLDL